MKKFLSILLVLSLITVAVFANGGSDKAAADDGNYKMVLLVKSLGNGFFEACDDGAQEAAGELGNMEVVYMGPSQSTAEGQIEIIETLIAQKVDAIAISANDRDALIPVTKKAMAAGIKVISWDSGINPGGRMVDLAPSNAEFIGRQQVQLIAELTGNKGQIGIVSSTSQATNQNEWIKWMYEEMKEPAYKDMEIVEVAYGDDASDKSYREAVGLFSKYPDLAGIISPTTIGILAAAKAIEDEGLQGKVQLTGLGLPSEMQHYIENGTCVQMALWNPVDLGYTATYICEALITGKITGTEGETISAGHMGDLTIGPDGFTVMGAPFVFNASNVAKFAAIF